MAFVLNESQQLNIFDSLGFMNDRRLRMLERSWAKPFSDHIFTNIDEMIFAPLYSEKANSRPNAPINVIVGALILKELTGMSDDEMVDACEFDLRFQYALHTTSFETQPISDRTFSRFRARCAAYELTSGKDLIHECIIKLSDNIRRYMEIDGTVKRMDSLMVESNIRKMGRLDLLHTCTSNLVKQISRDGNKRMLKGLEHYSDPNDRNRVTYHQSGVPYAERLQHVIDDAVKLLLISKEEYGDTSDYLLLARAIDEQTKDSDKGGNGRIPKEKGDRMPSSVLQNPADPDATYRVKSGKEHRGYAANVVEAVDQTGSVIVDYQYEANTHSDHDFAEETIAAMKRTGTTTALIADGAYSGKDIREQADKKNIGVLTTGLIGIQPKDITADFTFSKDGQKLRSCANGIKPESNCYIKQSQQIRASFKKEHCENCPYLEQCEPSIGKRMAVIMTSKRSKERALEIRDHKNDPIWELIHRVRNGVETIPSILRRKYKVDRIPSRGKIRSRQFFGFKIGALNVNKLWRYEQNLEYCRAFQA